MIWVPVTVALLFFTSAGLFALAFHEEAREKPYAGESFVLAAIPLLAAIALLLGIVMGENP